MVLEQPGKYSLVPFSLFLCQFRYKKRVYKQSHLDEKQLAKLHTKVGARRPPHCRLRHLLLSSGRLCRWRVSPPDLTAQRSSPGSPQGPEPGGCTQDKPAAAAMHGLRAPPGICGRKPPLGQLRGRQGALVRGSSPSVVEARGAP